MIPNRIYPFLVACILLIPVALQAQSVKVLEWKSDCSFNSYLVQQMKEQYEERLQRFNYSLVTRQTTQHYIDSIRLKYRQLLGPIPKKSKLNATTTGVIQKENYKIEKLVFESFPNHHVTANLYLPKGQGTFPAIVFLCGHEDLAKTVTAYQKTATLFAENGFLVLIIDPVSQGERIQLYRSTGQPVGVGVESEHTLLNASSNLFGLSTPGDELWDQVRAVDYLVTRKETDTSRIGCLGNDAGGIQTIFLSAYDKRVKAKAICGYLMNRERSLELNGPSDGCAHLPNEGLLGLEMNDYLMTTVSNPLLIVAARYEGDYAGTMDASKELQKVCQSLGETNKFSLLTYDDGEGMSQPKREAVVTWFRKYFYGDTTQIREHMATMFSERELMSTKTGQVKTEFSKEVSLLHRNLLLYKSSENARKKFLRNNRQQVLSEVRKLLGINEHQFPVVSQETGTVEIHHVTFHKLIVRKNNELPLPILMVVPSGQVKKVVIWLNENGKNQIADSSALIRSYLQQNTAVLLADLRGMGETQDASLYNDPKFYNREYRNAMLSLHIGKPLPGQRVTDILSIFQFLDSDIQLRNLPLEMNASGEASMPALHAALFEKKINSLTLYNSFSTFQQLLTQPEARNSYSSVIPGVLNYYDLPDLIRMVGAKKISFAEIASETRTW